jgi:pilus assembly protein Flp/PilA
MKEKLLKLIKEEEGTETVEWAIMIGLIAVASIGIIVGIGTWVNGKFAALSTGLAGGS